MNTIRLGDSLKQLRQEKDLTQKDLADESDVSDTIISRIENGHISDPKLSTVNRLARGLDMTTAEFIEISEEKDSTINKVLEFLRNHKDVLRSQYHVKNLGLFGSVARQDETTSSDLDLLVEYETGHRDIFNHSELEKYLESHLDRSVDLVMDSPEARESHERIYKNIKSDLIDV